MGLGLIIFVGGFLIIFYTTSYRQTRGVDRHNLVQGDNGTCNGRPRGQQKVTLSVGNNIEPRFVTTRLCSQLVIVNQDSRQHKITFTKDGQPITYNDIQEASIEPGKSQSVTLIDKGTFSFVDTSDSTIFAEFVVE